MSPDAYMFITAMFALVVKHWVADFYWQTERHLNKFSLDRTTQAIALADHCAVHAVCTIVALGFVFAYWIPTSDMLPEFFVIMTLGLAAVDAIFHYAIDYAKVELSRALSPKDRQFWLHLGADQTAHMLTYMLISWLATAGMIIATIQIGILG